MNYVVRFTKPASKKIERLDHVTAKRIHRRLHVLSFDPLEPSMSYSLEMDREKRSSRVGDWRIIYQIEESERVIVVLSVAPRGRAYRKL